MYIYIYNKNLITSFLLFIQDYESCSSDPEIQSPPHYAGVYMVPNGLAVRPPALARVSSDSVAVQMAHASLSTGSPNYCGSPVVAPCSPLTRVQHSSPSISSHGFTSHLNGSSLSSATHHMSGYNLHCYSQ